MLRFFDPLVHYSNSASLASIGGLTIGGAVDVPNTGGFQGGSHIRFSAAGTVTIGLAGARSEDSMGAVADTDTYFGFKLKVDGPVDWQLLEFRHAAEVLCTVRVTPNMGLIAYDKNGAVVGAVPGVLKQGVWHVLMVRMNAIASGQFTTYVDGRLKINSSGDFDPTSGFVQSLIIGDSGTPPAYEVHVDELIVWDAAAGDGFAATQSEFKMYAALPDTTVDAPTTVFGAASAHLAQDDPLNADNDADVTYAELTDTDLMTLGFPALPANTGFVRSVAWMAEMKEGADLEPDTAVLRFISNGTPDGDFDLKPGLSAAYEMFRHHLDLDPDIANFWTVGSAEAAELQVETTTAAPSLLLPNAFGSARTAPGQPELQISYDGTNWTSTNLVPYPNQVPRNVGRNVATGTIIFASDNGQVIRSTDEGLTWANINAGAALGIPLTFDGGAVWYGNGRWIMAGSIPGTGGLLYYSDDDGVSWSTAVDPDGGTGTGPTGTAPAGFSDAFYDGMWCPDLALHIGVGYKGAIWTSPDGATWTERTADNNYVGGFYGFRGIDWSASQGLLVAAGDPNEVQTSPDGINWTSSQCNATMSTMWGVVYSPVLDLWLVHGGGASNLPIAQTSPDAVTWTDRSLPAPNNHTLYSGGWDKVNNLFILTGRFGRAHKSSDGINWTYTPPDNSAGSFVGNTSSSIFAFLGGGNDK